MMTKKMKRFLKALSELSMEHGVAVEGGCIASQPVVTKLELKETPGEYRISTKAKQGLGHHFRWVATIE